MDNKPINKAAYKQAALQIAAGIRRLERGTNIATVFISRKYFWIMITRLAKTLSS